MFLSEDLCEKGIQFKDFNEDEKGALIIIKYLRNFMYEIY